MRFSIHSFFILWLLCILFAGILPARADVYRYIDAQGNLHFTDTPNHDRWNLYIKEKPSSSSATQSYQKIIRLHAQSFRLEEALVKAVIKVESDYQSQTVSRKGAQGLMQLIPETARYLKVYDPFDPNENIRGGSQYLRQMLDMFDNNLELALAAYNAGPQTVKRYKGIPPYDETRNYVKRVKYYLDFYRQQGES